MKTRLTVALAATAAIIGAAILLLAPVNVTFGTSGVVGCGHVFKPDTQRAELSDTIQQVRGGGLKDACDSALASREAWGFGLGGVGVLAGVTVVVLVARRPKSAGVQRAAA